MPSPYSDKPYSPWDLLRDIPPSLAYAFGPMIPRGPFGLPPLRGAGPLPQTPPWHSPARGVGSYEGMAFSPSRFMETPLPPLPPQWRPPASFYVQESPLSQMEALNQFPEPTVEPELEISPQELRRRLKAAKAKIGAKAKIRPIESSVSLKSPTVSSLRPRAAAGGAAAGGAAFLGQLPPFLALTAGSKVAQNYLDAYSASEGLEGVAARNQPDAPYVSAIGGWIGGLTAGAEMRAQEARRRRINEMRESLIKSGWGNLVIQ